MSEHVSPTPAAPTSPPFTPSPRSEAVKEAVEHLRAALPKLQDRDEAYARTLGRLLQSADDPIRLNQAEFQHRLAYSVRDVEPIIGQLPFRSSDTRQIIAQLATSAPNLTNGKLETLLGDASKTADMGLIRDVRRAAVEIGKQADQDTPQVRSQIETFENRLRLAPLAMPPQSAASPIPAQATPASPGLDASGRPVAGGTANAPPPSASPPGAQTGADGQHVAQQAVRNRTAEALMPMTAGQAFATSLPGESHMDLVD